MENEIVEKELSLNTPAEELESRLLSETDEDEVKNIIDLFNLNIQKKNVIRNNKLAELQDKISDQMQKRVEKNADAFSNSDLLDYFKTVQSTIANSKTSSEDIKVPIQITQQQVNVTVGDELDRESKQRVINAIQSILNKQNKEIVQEELDEPIEVNYDEIEVQTIE